jgi:hypothetical protein
VVEVENEFRELEAGSETTVLSEEPLGLKWYYEREGPDEELVEWNQSHRESGSVRAGD